MRRYVMKLRMIVLVFLSIFVACGVANADFYESFDDLNDYGPPSGSPPWTTEDDWGTFFPDSGLIYHLGSGGGGSYTAWHIDRPGFGKALKIYSDNPEITPGLIGMHDINDVGVRWKFDLWMGPSTGAMAHTTNALKFLHMGPASSHCIYLAGAGPTDSEVRYTNLETGGIGERPIGLSNTNLHLRIGDRGTPVYKLITNTDFDTLREQWVNLEIEIVTGNPAHVKIWVNGQLDFYRIFNGQNFFDKRWWYLTNYSQSAGGNFSLAIDEFYKYDSPKPPRSPEPPKNLRVIN
jgi:hypothetical protein